MDFFFGKPSADYYIDDKSIYLKKKTPDKILLNLIKKLFKEILIILK